MAETVEFKSNGHNAITDEMVNEAIKNAPRQSWNPDVTELADDADDAPSASMQGLQQAAMPDEDVPIDPMVAARDDAVRRYLSKAPDSALSRVMTR